MALYELGVSCESKTNQTKTQVLKKESSLLYKAADMGDKQTYETLKNFNIADGENKLEVVKKILEVPDESGHVLSQYKLVTLSSETKSAYYNIKKAIRWLEMTSNAGFVNVYYSLGLLLETDHSSRKEYQKITSLYQMAADKGHKLAQLVICDSVETYEIPIA
ncbi:hypothetical protein K501DRAFT_268474 [Backusella circina FSU 941]|nr:hypothetical protein K501DRAFT_268474 [Backusella circina FSU 941]